MPPKLPPQLLHTCRRIVLSKPIPPSHPTSPRFFSLTNNPPLLKTINSKNLPSRPKPPPEEEMEEMFVKGSGPGGQKINKTNSAVQIKHLPTGIVVKCQATRSRSQNRSIARQLLADRLDNIANGTESRSAVVGEVKRKKKASSAKKSRRKYRQLEEEKAAATGHVPGEDGLHPDDEEMLEEDDEVDPDDAVPGDGIETEPDGSGDGNISADGTVTHSRRQQQTRT